MFASLLLSLFLISAKTIINSRLLLGIMLVTAKTNNAHAFKVRLAA